MPQSLTPTLPPVSSQHGVHASALLQDLSSDILYDVFRMCLPSDMTDVSAFTSPLNLSQVCRLWRDTASLTPSLWATLTLRQKGDDHINLVHARDAWKVWLHHSRNAPLNVDIFVDRFLDDEDDQAFTDIMEMTFAQQHRWKNVHICCNSSTLNPHGKLRLAPGEQLEDLELRNHMPPTAAPGCIQNEIALDLSKSSRSLRSLQLDGVVKLSPCVAVMPNLRFVSIQARSASSSSILTIEDLFKILNAAPSIERLLCSFIIITPDLRPVRPLPCITLTRLRSLKLNVSGFDESFFKNVTCPALEELNVSFLGGKGGDFVTWVALVDFIYRSRPPLKQLHIYCNAIHDLNPASRREEELLSLLRLSPSLTSLTLHGQHISTRTMSALRLDRGSACHNICPNLHTLSVFCRRTYDFQPGCLVDMVTSRCSLQGALRSATFSLEGFERVDQSSPIQACVANGLSFTLIA